MENVYITTLHTGSEVERDGKTLEVEEVIEGKKETTIYLKPKVEADNFSEELIKE